ncbi:MAG TPA: hypothetical protein VFC38_11075 [Stellaceae bacterium]|nr:hypothetical protein [Stellaceae bacterium]
MKPVRVFVLILLSVLSLAIAAPAFASGAEQRDSDVKWHAASDCARKAFLKFPDYTPQGNAQRENYRRACLRSNGLPTEDGPAVQSH